MIGHLAWSHNSSTRRTPTVIPGCSDKVRVMLPIQILHDADFARFDRAVRMPRGGSQPEKAPGAVAANHSRRLIVHNTRSEAVSAPSAARARPTIRTNHVHVASADARPAHMGGQAQSCRRSHGMQRDNAQRISGHNREPSVLRRVRASRWEWDLASDRAWLPRLGSPTIPMCASGRVTLRNVGTGDIGAQCRRSARLAGCRSWCRPGGSGRSAPCGDQLALPPWTDAVSVAPSGKARVTAAVRLDTLSLV